MSGLILHYFDVYGRAEMSRQLLAKAGVEYTDMRYTQEQWVEVKPTMPTQKIPVLELADGTKMPESADIVRYLGEQYGYWTDNAEEAERLKGLLVEWDSMIHNSYMPIFAPEEGKAQASVDCWAAWEAFLTKNNDFFGTGHWFNGEKMTSVDFAFGSLYTGFFLNPIVGHGKEEFAALLVKYPNWKAWGDKYVAELPAGYLESQPPRHV